ncbi:MAG: hypothetical protein ACI9XU_000854 [Arenicella sp.]|jgi:hypothetical protein
MENNQFNIDNRTAKVTARLIYEIVKVHKI